MFAQVTTTVVPIEIIVEQPTDWLGVTVSVLLGVLTVGVAAWAVRTSQETARRQHELSQIQNELSDVQVRASKDLNRIERREQRWIDESRRSAHIQVTREVRQVPIQKEGQATWEYTHQVRFKNTGLAPAEGITWLVSWHMLEGHEEPGYPPELTPKTSLARLDPGEWFDFNLNYQYPPSTGGEIGVIGVAVQVKWRDPSRVDKIKYSVINWW